MLFCDSPLSSKMGFGKPQRTQRTRRKQPLSVPSASSVVNLLRHNQRVHPEEIKKPQGLPPNPASGRGLWKSKTSYVRQRYTKIEYQQG